MTAIMFPPRRATRIVLLLAACVLLPSVAPAAKRPGAKKQGNTSQSKVAFSDAAVAGAINRAREFLWSKQNPAGHWGSLVGKARSYEDGPTALATYALLASGVKATEPRMTKALDWLAAQKTEMTYCLGLRCNVWVLANSATNNRYRPQLWQDLKLLLAGEQNGGYGYKCAPEGTPGSAKGNPGRAKGTPGSEKGNPGRVDNSNSQYGVLGVWAAALAYEEIPTAYWQHVLDHWKACQDSDGGWSYGAKADQNSTATMTAGGLATLFVCFDNLLYTKFLRCKVDIDFKQLDKGLAWMAKNFANVIKGAGGAKLGIGDIYYLLYGVERVGLACGHKYLGSADWYKLGAERVLAAQQSGGAWNGKWDEVVSTSLATLFLVRGQHPVAFNKLEFKGDWNNRPRDLAQLTRWMSGAFERSLNWQVINHNTPVAEWHDAPILYISASDSPQFSEEDLNKLKQYINQGGTILSATQCNGRGFHDGIREVYRKILPDYELLAVPAKHPIYTVQNRLLGQPPFFMIHNGIRPLVLHTDQDLPVSWQILRTTTARTEFEIAANILLYVTDMGELRNRSVSHWPDAPKRQPSATVKLARVQYPGNWDPEPGAYERFALLLARRAGVKIEVEPVPAGALGTCDTPIACMTGTEKVRLSDDQKLALKQYVGKGGLLLVDAAGGSADFAGAVEADLQGAFDVSIIPRLAPDSPIYKLTGNEIESVSYRRKAKLEQDLRNRPDLRGIQTGNRLGVIFSRQDITGGLLGIPMYDCSGYAPESAYQIMRNAVLYSAKDAKLTQDATTPAADKLTAKKRARAEARTNPGVASLK